MDSTHTFLLDLLHQIETNNGKPLDDALRQAYLACPRHLFIPRYLHPITRQWCEVNSQNVDEHLPNLYADRSLGIYQPTDSPFVATISQPSLVLSMLELLAIQPGHSVFEIGAGSGWNAALIGQLVGPSGQVYTAEIWPELASSARQSVQQVNMPWVTVAAADGSAGYSSGAPFDRIIYTAGTYDIPLAIHQQLKEEGLLLAVLKIAGGGDDLVLFQKQQGILVSQSSSPVLFVPLLGAYGAQWRDGIELSTFMDQVQLPLEPVSRRPFQWGSRSSWNRMAYTEGVRSFLQLSEPGYRVFTITSTSAQYCFGVYDETSHSVVVAYDDHLISYGNTRAEEKLLAHLNRWLELGMPSSTHLSLRIHPKTASLPAHEGNWLLERDDSVFEWRLT